MAKTTEKYELMYIINPNLSEEETAAVVEKFKALVEQNGTLDEMEEMGNPVHHMTRDARDYLMKRGIS